MRKPLFPGISEFLLSAISWIPGFFFLIILSFFAIFKICTNGFAHLFHPELVPTYDPLDNLAIVQPNCEKPNMNVAALWILEEKLEIASLRNHFKEVFLSSAESRKVFANFYCYFVKWGPFVFKKYIKEIPLSEKITEKTLTIEDYGDLEKYFGDYVDINDYGNTPSWELVLIHLTIRNPNHNYSNWHANLCKAKTILLFKMDHGLVDGYSVLHIIDKLCGSKTPYIVKQKHISRWEKLKLLWSTPLNTLKLFTELSRTDDVPWPNCGEGNKAEMYTSFADLDLEKFKTARRLANCHFITLVGVLQVEVVRRYFESKKKPSLSIPQYAWTWTPYGWPSHPTRNGGPIKNHFSVTGFRVNLRSKNILCKINEAEQHYRKMTEGRKMPEANFHISFPLLWPLPRGVIRLITNVLERLRITSKTGLAFSSNLFNPEICSLLDVNVKNIYGHVRVSSFMESPRFQLFVCSFGERLNFCVGGRKDTFESKEEVEFVAKTLLNEAFDGILTALEEKDEQFSLIIN